MKACNTLILIAGAAALVAAVVWAEGFILQNTGHSVVATRLLLLGPFSAAVFGLAWAVLKKQEREEKDEE
jgi:hypothetical protein